MWQVHGDALWYTKFIQFQIWVTGDVSASREVHMFAHQLTTQTSLLPLETSANGPHGSPRLMECLGKACNVVAHVCRNMDLYRKNMRGASHKVDTINHTYSFRVFSFESDPSSDVRYH